MNRATVLISGIFKHALKGTLITWQKVSYEYDEWDCSLPSEILAEIEYWESLTPEELKAMALQ